MKKVLLLVALFASLSQILSAQRLITGSVLEAENGTPIPGVNITLKGVTTLGTITDLDGNFSINVPGNDAVLVFQFVGKVTIEETVSERSVINVSMENADHAIGDVVITAYGIRSNTTSSVEIDQEALKDLPAGNFQKALSGQAAGVMAVTSSGRPGSGSTVRIRGVNSISLSNEPLYVVDGVPVDNEHIKAINAGDIENMNILKDAAATSIYGARAANGVILITTKKGNKSEKPVINFRSQFGFTKIIWPRDFELMETKDFLPFQEHYFPNFGKSPTETFEEFYQRKFHKTRAELLATNTDWRREMLRDNQPIQQYEISARGGNETSTYFISAGYFDQKGAYHGSDFKRYNLRLNYQNSGADKLRFGTNIYGGYTHENNTVTRDDGAVGQYISNAYAGAHYIAPYIPFYSADGGYSSTYEGLSWAHPLDRVYNKDDYKDEFKLLGSLYAEYEIFNFLKFKTTFGGEYWTYLRTQWTNPFGPEGASVDGRAAKRHDMRYKLINTNLLTFNKEFAGVHDLTVILGHEAMQYKRSGFHVQAINVPTDQIKTLDAFSENENYGGDGTEYRVLSYFANASYNFANKYFFEATYRLDGCSRFGENNRFGNFYSLGGSWNLKQESFLSTNDMVTGLRLSASYGTSGNYGTDNSGLGNFEHVALYNFSSKYNGASASSRSSLGNPNLSWETVSKANVAVNADFFNKYNLTVELYKNKTSDMLYNVPLSRTTGFSSIRDNVCSMENTGIELSLRANILKMSGFDWNVSANFTYNKNKITDLLGEEVIGGGYNYTILKEGYSYGTFYLPKFAGINPATGDAVFYTRSGELTEEFNTAELSQVIDKSYIPPYFGGISTDVSFKGITLSVHGAWAYKKYLFNDIRNIFATPSIYQDANKSVEVLTAWDQPGDITEIPSPFRGKPSNQATTDRTLEDASYFKIKNVTLSYTLPVKLVQRAKISSVRVFAQADNLYTFTRYKGNDPEFTYPGGTDIFPYPNVTTYTFGLDLSF